jgi:hypothetical protein
VSWFSGLRSSQPVTQRPASSGHRSPALKGLLEGLRPGTRRSVLDLGPPLGPNIELLSRFGCRVRIADFYRSLAGEPVTHREPEAFGSLVGRLLPLDRDERFDIVLVWDVFNYLRPDQISSLMARLAPACRLRAMVFALMSTRRQIPAAPLCYRILDHETLRYEGSLEAVRPCPRYAQPDLTRMMPGFRVEGSFLLRNGLQEYLFARGKGGAAAPG